MRRLAPLLIGGVLLVSCTTAPEPDQPSPSAQRALAALLAGKVAGPPVSCLPNYDANDMRIIDGRTVAYRAGSRTVYVMHLSEGCHLLGSGNYALLTRETGGLGKCRGDIARVFDATSRTTVGSCAIEGIVPYKPAGAR
jgi:uncharacterized protein DUF6491